MRLNIDVDTNKGDATMLFNNENVVITMVYKYQNHGLKPISKDLDAVADEVNLSDEEYNFLEEMEFKILDMFVM